ncbi:hypothetical protein MRB53_026584 [Persea americana]|uniref:Uncharacterized protein n=1 Tax=Persea americana TaxID=3435 RepID=A0ACC2LIR5_PERAE|nr:hypothetical protein MRB53_026584 [Persea americana]
MPSENPSNSNQRSSSSLPVLPLSSQSVARYVFSLHFGFRSIFERNVGPKMSKGARQRTNCSSLIQSFGVEDMNVDDNSRVRTTSLNKIRRTRVLQIDPTDIQTAENVEGDVHNELDDPDNYALQMRRIANAQSILLAIMN